MSRQPRKLFLQNFLLPRSKALDFLYFVSFCREGRKEDCCCLLWDLFFLCENTVARELLLLLDRICKSKREWDDGGQ